MSLPRNSAALVARILWHALGYDLRLFRCWKAITSLTTPAPASCTRRLGTVPMTTPSGLSRREPRARLDTAIPFTVDADGVFTKDAPGFEGKRVLNEKGDKGDANDAVIKALAEAGALIARGRLKHQYPHSWRSKKPVIFRNTPQWFIAMDKPVKGVPKSGNQTLRQLAVKAIDETEWVPQSGENRILGMVEGRPDWVVSRQRAWGVPITIFRHKETGEVIPSAKFGKSKELMARITQAFAEKGADVWFEDGAKCAFSTASSRARPTGSRCATSSMCGSIVARRTPSRWRTRSISRRSPASSACATAARTASCISKAPTSTAAGSSHRCWNPAARVPARPTTSC